MAIESIKHVSARQLVYRFHELPHVIQREIMHDMKLVLYSEKFESDYAMQTTFFKRLSAANRQEELRHRLFPNYRPDPPVHPCDS